MSNILTSLPQQSSRIVIQLPLGVLQDACNYLGPSCSSFRAVCVPARLASNHLEVVEEILKWHCVSGALLYLCPMLRHSSCLEHLGKLRLLCTVCDQALPSRHVYRLIRRPREESWGSLGMHSGSSSAHRCTRYVCCMCIFNRLREFLQGRENFVEWLIDPVIKGQLITGS